LWQGIAPGGRIPKGYLNCGRKLRLRFCQVLGRPPKRLRRKDRKAIFGSRAILVRYLRLEAKNRRVVFPSVMSKIFFVFLKSSLFQNVFKMGEFLIFLFREKKLVFRELRNSPTFSSVFKFR
jgi:hypothetical protein